MNNHDPKGHGLKSKTIKSVIRNKVNGVDRRVYGERFPVRTDCEFEFDRETETLTVKVPIEPANAKLRAA